MPSGLFAGEGHKRSLDPKKIKMLNPAFTPIEGPDFNSAYPKSLYFAVTILGSIVYFKTKRTRYVQRTGFS